MVVKGQGMATDCVADLFAVRLEVALFLGSWMSSAASLELREVAGSRPRPGTTKASADDKNRNRHNVPILFLLNMVAYGEGFVCLG